MKRVFSGLIAICLIFVSASLPAHASTNDFTFTSFEADYYLGADSEGRSTLKTVEKLVADFPSSDQNHGIERAIPKKYDSHPVSLEITSVTDENGKALSYSTDGDGNDNEVLRIGDGDTYVHGQKTYVITYTQRDVTKYFANVGDHEFYWDTNGLEWKQPFERVTARVHLSDSIKPTFTNKLACYQGASESTRRCDISNMGGVISAQAENLKAGENMTIAIGFTAGTFRGYQPSLWDRIYAVWLVVFIVTSVIGFGAIIWLAYRYAEYNNRSAELAPIPTEYIPPKGASVLTSAKIGDGTKADMTAMIMDLAVRHYITISQTAEKSLLKQAEYELQIVKPVESLLQEEKDFIMTLFGSLEVGTVFQTKKLKNGYGIYSQLQKNSTELVKKIKSEYGLRAKNEAVSKSFKRIGLVLLLIGVVSVSPLMFVAAIVAYGCGWGITPLTDKGLDLRRYLAGLKVYIELAEKDRINALQSPEGAEKTGVAVKTDSDKKLIRLYERVLPYAVLFGQEKEWNKRLSALYESSNQAPGWYSGHAAFNAAVFTSTMNDFSTSMNSYGSSGSSSSGGSSGGGSSGGGGGGGGGGGW